MPELCRFFGLVITMYHREHGVPHVHVRYGGEKATIEVESERVRGTLPHAAQRLALEWTRVHRAELMDNWRRAQAGEALRRMHPPG